MRRWFAITLGTFPAAPELLALTESWELPPNLCGAVDAVRIFKRLGVIAVHADESAEPLLQSLPGATRVVLPEPLSLREVGKWYVSILAGWDELIGRLHSHQGIAVNFSLGPVAGSGNTFDAHEPANRATWMASQSGLVVVVAAGNNGEHGNDTLTRWAKAPWVVAVGASDRKGRTVQPYSSRGVPDQIEGRPTVVAPGFRNFLAADDEGTSFAAQHVTDVAHLLLRFALRVRTASAVRLLPVKQTRLDLASFVRNALRAMAVPIGTNPHESGDGFVSLDIAHTFLKGVTPQEMQYLLGTPDPPSHADLRAAQQSLRDGFAHDHGYLTARASIDTSFEWTRPTFVQGLIRKPDGYWLCARQVLELGADVDCTIDAQQAATFLEVSIYPRRERGRELVVTAGAGQFPTITAALAAAGKWDVIRVRAGEYREALRVPSGVTIQGDDGVEIRSRGNPPIAMIDVEGVALINLTIIGEDAGVGAIFMENSRHIELQRCRVRSDRNAIMGVSVIGCSARECEFHAKANAAYFISSRDLAFRDGSYLVGQTGALLYGSSASFVGCAIKAVEGDAIMFIARRKPWMSGGRVRVFIGAAGVALVRPRQLQASSPQRDDLTGIIARHLYGLLVGDTQLIAGNTAIAATTFEPVVFDDYHTEAGRTNFALIQGPQPLPVKTAGLSRTAAVTRIQNTLNPLRYTPTLYAPVPPLSWWRPLALVELPRWLRWLTGRSRVE